MYRRMLVALGVAAVLSTACRLPGQAPAPEPNPPRPAAASTPVVASPGGAAPANSASPPGRPRPQPSATLSPAPPVARAATPAGLPAGFPLLPGRIVVSANSPTDPSGLMMGLLPARGTVEAGVTEAGRLLSAAGWTSAGFRETAPASYSSGPWVVELSRYAGFGEPLVGYRVWKKASPGGSGGSGGSGGKGGTVMPPGFGGNGGVAGP
jgi:hypothetical protein